MKNFQAAYIKKQQEEMQVAMKEKLEKGEWGGLMGTFQNQASKTKQAMNAENRRFMSLHGQVYDPKTMKDDEIATQDGAANLLSMLNMGDTDGSGSGGSGDLGQLPMIRPGDASVAAPFTSRVPSVRAVVDLIRQGRCTLLSALMQQQIMMLESIISAYTLSALSLHNARSSERQMMASSWLIMTAAVAFSYASSIDKMHPQRPLHSLWHPAVMVSILGQALIHVACMSLAVSWATEAMGPELLKEVTEFFRKAKAKQLDQSTLCDEDDFMCQMNLMWSAPFMPNLLNSTVFLVETSQMISVYFANYKGRPWMKGMLENHPLFLSVFICIGGLIVLSWEMVPQLNELIQLAPLPSDGYYKQRVIALVVASIFATLAWDRLCTWLFAPKVFGAMLVEVNSTRMVHILPVLRTAGMIIGGVALLASGNILLWIGAYMVYRQYNQAKQPPAPSTTATA
jgi:cation-transporting ATPase 13A1